MAEPAADRRRTFGPVVLLGLATAGLAAVSAAKPWVGTSGASGDASLSSALDTGTRYPLGSAISLVLLASWGVLLVTRGKVRRAFAWIAALAAVGLVAAVIAAYATLPGSSSSSYARLMGHASKHQGFTGWFWTAAVCAVLAVGPAVLAVRLVGAWPEMGSRYDAPGTREQVTEPEPSREQDLWKALDEGRDPTDTNRS
jgi:uncharacterized membrane protein (TIGR02234 family)